MMRFLRTGVTCDVTKLVQTDSLIVYCNCVIAHGAITHSQYIIKL